MIYNFVKFVATKKGKTKISPPPILLLLVYPGCKMDKIRIRDQQ
jgi:hypothetical protein